MANTLSSLRRLKCGYAISDTAQRSHSHNTLAQDKLGGYTQPAMNEAYAYDPLGNRTTKTDGSNPLYYVYDAANQLKEIRQTDAAGALLTAMIYDANGNLTQKCEGGSVTTNGTTSCTGASVTTLTYDALNQLTGVNKDGQLSQYAYDDAGRRIKKTVNGSTVNYLYNGPDILAEYQNWSKANVSYTHGPNTDDPLIRVTAANDNSYFHQDGLGSVVATTDQTGNLTAAQLYDAWGKPQQGASLNNLGQYGYTGREPDETGMMYYRARYYDPTIGRFTQRDPAGMPDGVNRYAYVANDPVNFTDPSGEIALIDNFIGGAFNTAVGYGIASLTDTDYSWKQATIDFGVGFASSGVAGIGKVYKALTYTNTAVGKATVAASGEFGKAAVSGQSTTDPKTLFNASTAAALNATGVVGKVSTAIGKKIPGVSAGLYEPNKNVAALFQAPALAPGVNKVVEEALSLPGNIGAGLISEKASDLLGGISSSGGNNSNSYFSNMQGAGGSGSQTMFNVSPRY